MTEEAITRGALVHAESVPFALGKLSDVERPVRARTSADAVQIAIVKLALKHIARRIDLLAKPVWLSFEKVALDSIAKSQIRSHQRTREREFKRERESSRERDFKRERERSRVQEREKEQTLRNSCLQKSAFLCHDEDCESNDPHTCCHCCPS